MAVELRRLPGPMEYFDLADRETKTLRVVSWEQGSAIIHTERHGVMMDVEIPVLRLHLAPGIKLAPPMYYDISSKTLQAQLLPMLMERVFERYEYVITKFGVAPRARFTLERVPI